MIERKRYFSIVLASLFIMSTLFLASCNNKKENGDSAVTTTATTSTTQTVPPAVDVDIALLATAVQVSDAFGIKMTGPEVLERGETSRFVAEDGDDSFMLSIEEMTLDEFNESVEDLDATVDAPNLGETAKWNADDRMLVVLSGKYLLTFYISSSSKNAEQSLLIARTLAVNAITALNK